MQEEPYASRRELDMLAARVDSMDHGGTRGMLALGIQLSDATKDITDLKIEMSAFKRDTASSFEKHLVAHEDEHKDRINSKRWMVGIATTGMLIAATIIGMLLQVLTTVH